MLWYVTREKDSVREIAEGCMPTEASGRKDIWARQGLWMEVCMLEYASGGDHVLDSRRRHACLSVHPEEGRPG
jgi:hypothetical protein